MKTATSRPKGKRTAARPVRKRAKLAARQLILVPTDFSRAAGKALDYAQIFAREQGASTIVLLHVAELPSVPDFADFARLTRQNRQILEESRARLEQHARDRISPDLDHSILVRQGRAFQEIIQAAQTSKSSMIIMATHGATGLKRALLGSNAERVVRHAKCPVLIVRPGERDFVKPLRRRAGKAGVATGAPSAPVLLRNILVPVDFSPESKTAVAYAAGLARRHKAMLRLVYVVPTALALGEYGGIDYASLQTEMQNSAIAELNTLAARLVPSDLHADALVRNGTPAEEILEAARAIPADLIVTSTHGRTGLSHVLIGSVAEQIVRHAPCPVLVLRKAKKR